MNFYRLSIFMLMVLSILFAACSDDNNNNAPPEGYTELPEGFKTFYKKFHQDSAYQMEHIIWPLQGLPPKADSATVATDTFVWTKENWRIHAPFKGKNSAYNRYFEAMGQNLIIETFISKQGNFGIVRRWAKMDDEWYLIYYIGNNKLNSVKNG